MDFLGVSGGTDFGGRSIGGIIGDLLTPIFALAGMIALLFLIWGGIKYMTARGDPKSIDAARNTITSAIIGLLIVILSAVIMFVVGTALKIDVLGQNIIPAAHAVDIGGASGLGDNFANIGELFTNVIRVALAAAALIFLAMMIWGGYKYLNAGGDADAAQAARGTLTSALIGVLIIVVSFIIIEVISTITGAGSIFSTPFS